MRVTNLNDSGPGSLRAALTSTGARIVLFDVSGTINLTSDISLDHTNSYLTVAGQTSSGGVQIKGGPNGAGASILLHDGIHDVIIRHLRVRPGGPPPYPATIGGCCADAQGNILVYGDSTANGPVTNIIIDHSSLQWAGGKTIQNYENATNITWQWNIIASGLPTPGSGCTPGLDCSASYGGGGGGYQHGHQQNLSFHHNLWAHLGGRSPAIQRSGLTDFLNNIVYNWGSNGPPGYLGSNAMEWGEVAINHSSFGNFVNNHYIAGPNSQFPGTMFALSNGGAGQERGGTKIYTSGNWSPQCPSGCANDWDNGFKDKDLNYGAASESKYRVSTPYPTPAITTTPTTDLRSLVTATVGAYKPSRDSVDARVINDVLGGTGNISTIGNGGPWPILSGGSSPLDTDGDGIPDSWEITRGLNPKDPSDGSRIAANGYTNVENYLNELAGDPIPGMTTTPPPPPPPSPTPTPVPPPSSPSWTFCANEEEQCNFTSTKEVRYGLNGVYFYKTFTNGVFCSNSVFGDPLVGAAKICEYRDVVSTKFQIGGRVQVSSGPLNVRELPSITGLLFGIQPTSAQGTIIFGPILRDGYTWWDINYDTGIKGWSVENWLK